MKLICADRVSVGLSYDANFKWHKPICVGKCREIMPFFGTVTDLAFRKKVPKHKNVYNDAKLSSGFFCETRSVTVSRFGFFSRIYE